MSRLRLLPLHLLLLSSLPLAAQSPAAPNIAQAAESTPTASKTSVLRIPFLSSLTLTPFEGQAAPTVKLFQLPRTPHAQIRIAQNEGPCFTMRSSKFTARDLDSSAPKPSSYSTCTPGADRHVKNVEAVSSK